MRRSAVVLAFGLVLVAASACHRDRAGRERGPCRKSATPCEAGLVCMSELCVRPPPADCGAVAEALVSIELGNYASREDRAAALPAKRALCERERISVEEAACLGKATDVWAASTCVPRMFPHTEAGGCDQVMAKLRAAVDQAAGSDPRAKAMIDKAMTVLLRSCVADEWPPALRQCILDASATDPAAFDRCEKAMPPGLKEKLEQRLRDVR